MYVDHFPPGLTVFDIPVVFAAEFVAALESSAMKVSICYLIALQYPKAGAGNIKQNSDQILPVAVLSTWNQLFLFQ